MYIYIYIHEEIWFAVDSGTIEKHDPPHLGLRFDKGALYADIGLGYSLSYVHDLVCFMCGI